ncbi:hypothetical protein LTR36_010191 [Oleoguttula mirabilis]|uniref:Uncharacterized protein n=1 Tax=Oleoguttula mirabilis TaxID=1507867 RepID=A0AAV9JSE5_9PEZI|nr:hypothetical protein LTR36_010191 [Oleoguttula mirabilis]
MPTTHTDGNLAWIGHLLAEKDRLVAEKDELVASKDKLWREMYRMLRERDARIERLEAEVGCRKGGGGEGMGGVIGTRQGQEGSECVVDGLRGENNKLVERNRALEEALRQLLDREEEEEDGDGVEGGCGEMQSLVAIKPEPQLEKGRSLSAPVSFQKHLGSSPAYHQASMPSPDSDDVPPANKPPSTTTLPTFTFAPLISLSPDGLYETGSIATAAPAVLRSIRAQLATLASRVREGKSPAVPSTAFHSTGCLWMWMMSAAPTTRWTVSAPREFACASCFAARRACLLWLGNLKYIILPLPPRVREAHAMTWEDAGFYIEQRGEVRPEHFPGLWKGSKKTGGKRTS